MSDVADFLVRSVGRKRAMQILEDRRDGYQPRPTPPRKRGPGYVYFLSCGEFIKIGYSADTQARHRVKSIQVSSPHEVRLLCVIEGGRKAEAKLLARFHHLRHRGEWFRAEPELLTFIDQLAGSRL